MVDYEWDFLDGTTANGQNVTHSYSAPGQYRVQLFVTDDNGCSNPNLIDLEVLVATVPTFDGFPQDTTLCLGESIAFTATPQLYEVEWTGFVGSQSVDDGCLPDTLLGVSQDIQLLQTGFSAGTTITDVSDIQDICLDLEHSFMGDLVILIECPNGQSSILHQQGGGGTQIGIPNPADNVDCSDPSTLGTPFTYCFSPTATETWVDWVNNNPGQNTIPAGTYESIDPLDNLVGCPTNGVWTLTVIDNWAADDGTLFSFALNLDPSFYPPVSTFEPQIGLNSDSSYWLMPAPHVTNLSVDGNVIDITPTAAGTFTYEYYVIDNFGCTNDSSVNLTVNENPIVFAGNDTTLCVGENLQLVGELSGPGAVTICEYTLVLEDIFFDGWNGATITVDIAGTATDYTLANGGIDNIPLFIPSGSNVTVTFNANGFSPGECFYSVLDPTGMTFIAYANGQTTVIVDNFVSDCTPDFVYDWAPAASLNDPTIIDPFMTVTGNETLTLTVFPTGHPLCAVSDDIAVSVAPLPDAGVDAAASFCSTGAPSDLFPLLGATAETGGEWTDPNGNVIVMPYDPNTMPPGQYTYALNVNGCTDEALVDVTHVATTITSLTAVDISCNGLTDGSITFDGDNADGYTINGGTPVVAPMPVTLNGLAPGNYDVIIASADGCFDTQTITVNEPDLLTLAVTPTDASCFGFCDGQASSVVNGGTGAMTYTWLQGVNGDQNGNATGICSGNYQVEVEDANGCKADDTYFIDQPADISPGLTIDTAAGCFPHQVDFVNVTGSPDILSTEIDFGDGSTATINGVDAFEHTYDAPGVYTVTMTVTTNGGCVYSITYDDLIEAFNIPNANFFVNPDFVSMLEPTVSLYSSSSSDVVQFDWTIFDGTPATASTEDVINVDFPADAPGLYPVKLEVESDQGCIDSITKFVTIINDVILYAPNTFTPDDDEFNQAWEFHISGIDIFDFNLKIFNRWGQVIWESNDPSVSWDGTYNGRIVQNGVYTWAMECADGQNDKRYTFEGHINVIK